SVPPPVQVDTGDVAEREDRALDAYGDAAEVGGELVGQVGERVDVHATREPDRAEKAARNGRVQRPVVVRPHRRRRVAGADAARRAAGLAAPRRLRDLPRSCLARDERLEVWKGHADHDSFRGVSTPAIPCSTTPTTRARASAAGHSWRPRRWTNGHAVALNAMSAARTTSSAAGSEPSAAPSRRNWMNGCR